MTFDNSQAVIKIQMLKRLYAVLTAVLVALNYTTRGWSYIESFTGIPRWVFTVLVLSVFLGYYLLHVIRKSQFIYFSDDESKIIIRFYSLTVFDSKKNSYEIPKSQFVKATTKESFFGLRREIILYQRIGEGIAQYPPFSISSLTPEEQKKVISALVSYTR